MTSRNGALVRAAGTGDAVPILLTVGQSQSQTGVTIAVH